MIATILPGSANFHAVGYNERKVSNGVARLLEIQNFGTLGTFGKPTPDDMVRYLQEYTSRNSRIRKAQFHVAISCKGHEQSEEKLLEFAHRYLKEMGYAEPGQPLLVYSHYDTDNTHLHIVTSRIAPDGRKIAHDHERRRSQEAIDRILGMNRKKETGKDVDAAMQYTFSTFAQFKAVMSSLCYEAYQKDGTSFIKRGGKVWQKLPLSEIESLYQSGYRDRTRCRQLRSILKKYRDVSMNKEELQKELKAMFGIDLVFFGKKDKPYGYMLVDHANKTVTNGARVLAMDELLDFATPEERLDRIEDFIDRLLTLNLKMTQGEIYDKIRKQRAYIRKGVIHFDGQTRPLKPFMAEAIDRNNRIAWVEKFQPSNEAERDVLCKIFKVNRPDLVTLSPDRDKANTGVVHRLLELFNDEGATSVRSSLYVEGFILREEGDAIYAVNFKRHILINLKEEGFDIERLRRKPANQRRTKSINLKSGNMFTRPAKLRDAGGGSRSEKREWEVGHKGDYDEIDDGRSLKR